MTEKNNKYFEDLNRQMRSQMRSQYNELIKAYVWALRDQRDNDTIKYLLRKIWFTKQKVMGRML